MVVLLFSTRFQCPVPAPNHVLALCTIVRTFANPSPRFVFLVDPGVYPILPVAASRWQKRLLGSIAPVVHLNVVAEQNMKLFILNHRIQMTSAH